jgi:hypothetical protein
MSEAIFRARFADSAKVTRSMDHRGQENSFVWVCPTQTKPLKVVRVSRRGLCRETPFAVVKKLLTVLPFILAVLSRLSFRLFFNDLLISALDIAHFIHIYELHVRVKAPTCE